MKTSMLLIAVSVVLFFFSMFRIPETSKQRSTVPLSEPTFRKLIYLVVDGLRFDGYVPVEKSGYYYNNFTFIQDPVRLKTTFFSLSGIPTCTTCRVIGMMSGAPSNQIEELMTFFVSKLGVESLPDKFADRKMHHYGDSLWPQSFEILKDKSYSFCGLSKSRLVENEEDLIGRVLEDRDSEIRFVHLISLDALGHIYTTNHQAISESMRRVDIFLHKLYDSMDEDTLLLVASDHGVTDAGAHGGNSSQELASVCGFYSKRALVDEDIPHFGDVDSIYNSGFLRRFYDVECFNRADDWVRAKHPYKVVHQDDILPTIACLMGVPAPINTYGNLIPYLIRTEKPYRILAQQKQSIAGKLEGNRFPDVLSENYHLTDMIYRNAVGTRPLLAMLSAVISLYVLARVLDRPYRLVSCIPFIATTVMVSLSYWCFASEDILWILTLLITNFSCPNLIFSIWYLKTPGRVLFQDDRMLAHLKSLNSLEAVVLVMLFFISKNMTMTRKQFLSPREDSLKSINGILYHNTLFCKQLQQNAVHLAMIAYEAVFGCDRISKICLLCQYPSLDTLICTHLGPTVSMNLLYFAKNLDLAQSPSTKHILLSFSPYLLNIEKVVQSINYNVFFVLSDGFGSVANVLGVFAYLIAPRILVHKQFKITSLGLVLNLFGLYFCFACSWAMHGSLVFQYFFVGRLLFTIGFFACDMMIEGFMLASKRLGIAVI